MGDPAIRQAIVLELFAATGESIPADDPIVTGAILFSHKLNEVARVSAQEMQTAGRLAADSVTEASQRAELALSKAGERCAAAAVAAASRADAVALAVTVQLERLTAERAQLLKAIDAQVSKSVKLACPGATAANSFRYIPTWHAVAGAIVAGIVLATGWHFAFGQGAEHAQEAAIGRTFTRAVSTMDPKLREQVIDHIRKAAG